MTSRFDFRLARNRTGAVIVEFAVICPVLLLLAFACTDFGRIAHHYQVVSNAARTGAETGATRRFTPFTRSSWEAKVRQSVLEELASLEKFDESQLEYQLTASQDENGIATIQVEISYPFQTIVSWPGIPSQTMLHRQVVYRQFR